MSELGIWGARKVQDALAEKNRREGKHTCPMLVCKCETDEECKKKGCWCCNHAVNVQGARSVQGVNLLEWENGFPKCGFCGKVYRSAPWLGKERLANHLRKVHGRSDREVATVDPELSWMSP